MSHPRPERRARAATVRRLEGHLREQAGTAIGHGTGDGTFRLPEPLTKDPRDVALVYPGKRNVTVEMLRHGVRQLGMTEADGGGAGSMSINGGLTADSVRITHSHGTRWVVSVFQRSPGT